MAFFQATWSATPANFNIHSVRAGDADEMVTRLTDELAAAVTAGEGSLVDLYVSGSGAGLDWEAWFVTASAVSGGASVTPSAARVRAAVAGNPAEARLLLMQALADFGSVGTVFKIEVAGAGIDPTYMAVAIFNRGG